MGLLVAMLVAASVDGGLSEADVADVMGLGSLSSCASRKQLRVDFQVDAEGRVVPAKSRPACVREALAALRFPPSDAGTSVRWTIADAGAEPPLTAASPELLAPFDDDVAGCYDAALADEVPREGSVALTLTVLRSGAVADVTMAGLATDFTDTTLLRCLEAKAHRWRFEPSPTVSKRVAAWSLGTSVFRAKRSASLQARIIASRAPVKGGVDIEGMHRVIVAKSDAITACYQRELDKADLEGGVTAVWKIEPDGSVGTVTLSQNTLNANAGACITNIIKRMQFEPPVGGKVTNIEVPWNFTKAMRLGR